MSNTIIMRMKDMTAKSEADLCPSCAYCYERKGQSFKDTVRICNLMGSMSASHVVTGRICDCTGYYPKNLPSIQSMNDIAWEITSKGERGNRHVGFISPEDRRKSGIGPSPVGPGFFR